MLLGTIILMFLLPILASVMPIRQDGRSCGELEIFERKKSLVMIPVNRRIPAVVMWAFVLLLTSCQQDGTVERAGKRVDRTVEQAGKHIEESTTAISDDLAITAKIKGEFIDDPLLKIAQLEVTTSKGIVKLSGFVNSQKSIDRAQEIARSVKGVRSIESSLLVKSY